MATPYAVRRDSDDAGVDLLEEWRLRSRGLKRGHYDAARRFARQHYALGVPVVVLSAVAGTSALASVAESSSIYLRVIAGVLSVSAGVLAALQTFLKLNERAVQHKAAAAGYSAVCREIEASLAKGLTKEEIGNVIDSVRERLDAFAQDVPTLSHRVADSVKSQLESNRTSA